MLVELNIEDFAIIEKAQISFSKGLNIITGETGTGKSIMVDALNLVLGGRADKNYIKDGKEKTVVQSLFIIENRKNIESILNDYGIDLEADGSLLITREIHLSGRSIARVNGHIVTLTMLSSITDKLIDIQGQHEHQSLLSPEKHMDFVDLLGDDNLRKLKREVKKEHAELSALKTTLKGLTQNEMERERTIDLLQFQVEEIEEIDFKVDEEEELIKSHKLLTNAEELSKHVSTITDQLSLTSYNSNSVIDEIRSISKTLGKITFYDDSLSVHEETLDSISFTLEDIAREISDYGNSIDFDFDKLNEIENRLSILNKLKRKYGSSIAEIFEYRDKVSKELNIMLNLDEEIEKINIKIEEKEKALNVLSEKLTTERKKIGDLLEKAIISELSELNMEDVEFKVDIKQLDHFTKNGRDKIEFFISTNVGQSLRPLSKVASGGEMSRIMLGFKNILADVDDISSLVFDEIDTGISGRTAQIVGEKILQVSKKHQVICITHLPQIAAMSDTHFLIRKQTEKGTSTKTSIVKLKESEKTDEICRLISGVCVTEITKKHAEEMIKLSKQYKQSLD